MDLAPLTKKVYELAPEKAFEQFLKNLQILLTDSKNNSMAIQNLANDMVAGYTGIWSAINKQAEPVKTTSPVKPK